MMDIRPIRTEADYDAAWAIQQARPESDQRRRNTLARMLEFYRATGREAKAAEVLEHLLRSPDG